MPILNIELNDTELNKLKNKVIKEITQDINRIVKNSVIQITKDINRIVKNSVIQITKDEASAYLLKQLMPKITQYTDKISDILSEKGIEKKIMSMAHKHVSKEVREAYYIEIQSKARDYANDRISNKNIDDMILMEVQFYIEQNVERKLKDKFNSFKSEVLSLVEDLKEKVDIIHKNQDYLAQRINILPVGKK